jgi:hypothetical protein
VAAIPQLRAPLPHLIDFPLHSLNPHADPAAIGLELRLARTACTDAATKARQRCPGSGQTRQQVFELGELHFEPPGPGSWALDPVHHPRPVTRYWEGTHPEPFTRGVQEFSRFYGLLFDGMQTAYINGFAYHARPPVPDEEVPQRFARAEEVFAHLRVWNTERNTGVLVYVLLADHAIEIVAVRGVAREVDASEWMPICAQMQRHFLDGGYEGGAIAGVEASHFATTYPVLEAFGRELALAIPRMTAPRASEPGTGALAIDYVDLFSRDKARARRA